MRGRYIAGIDVGSTKVCAVVGRIDRGGGMEIIASGVVPSAGMKKGVVIDIEQTANSIGMAVKEAQTVSGVDIRAAYVGVAGNHMKCVESYGATGIKGKEVRHGDIERVIEAASAVYVPLDREILHVLASEFVIDGQDGIARPMGMAGVRLEVRVQVLSASGAVLENLEKAVSRAGLKAADMVFQPLASALAALKPEEMEQGVLLIDMGGGTTDIVIFKGGALRHASVVPVGGLHITNDLAVGLKLPQKEAERLKRRHTGSSQTAGRGLIEAEGMNGKTKNIPAGELDRIVRLRGEEIFELVKNDVEPSVLKHKPLCVVLTGGAAMMGDVADMAERWFSLPVRIGAPERVKSSLLRDVVKEPQYSTAVGLLLYGLEMEGPRAALPDSLGAIRERVFSSQGWAHLRRLFSRVPRALRAGYEDKH